MARRPARRPGMSRRRPAALFSAGALLLKLSNGYEITVGNDQVDEDAGFRLVRNLFDVHDDFLSAPQVDLSNDCQRLDGGMHACGDFSRNGLYLVKNIADNEWANLHRMLPDYTNHLRDNTDSLLPRFFSAFILNRVKYVAMFNWVRGGDSIVHSSFDRLFDLKASTCSQAPNDRMRVVPLNHGIGDDSNSRLPTLKDLNFVQLEGMIWLPADERTRFVYQIRRDTAFLSNLNLMDYSMLISVRTLGQCEQNAMQELCDHPRDQHPLYRGFFQEWQGRSVSVNENEALMRIYTFGMIDVLNDYTWSRSAAASYRSATCGDGQVPDTVGHAAYKTRFDQFFSDRTQSTQIRGLDRESECMVAGPRRLGGGATDETLDGSAEEDAAGASPRRLDRFQCQMNQIVPSREVVGNDLLIWPLAIGLGLVTLCSVWILIKLRQAGGVCCGEPEDQEPGHKPNKYKHRETEIAMMYADAAYADADPDAFTGKSGAGDFGFAPASNTGGDFGIAGGGPPQFSSQMPAGGPPQFSSQMPASNAGGDFGIRGGGPPQFSSQMPAANAGGDFGFGLAPPSGMDRKPKPGSGMPQSGMGMPQSGMPQSGMPQSGMPYGSNMPPSYGGGQPQWR